MKDNPDKNKPYSSTLMSFERTGVTSNIYAFMQIRKQSDIILLSSLYHADMSTCDYSEYCLQYTVYPSQMDVIFRGKIMDFYHWLC